MSIENVFGYNNQTTIKPARNIQTFDFFFKLHSAVTYQ